MQSGSCTKARSRIQRAVTEGRVYTFVADIDKISRLGSGDPLSSMEELGGGILAGRDRGVAPLPVNCVESHEPGAHEASVKYALSITHRALAELDQYEHQGEHFVLISEIPEAPVFHHLALRCVHVGGLPDTGMIIDGPALFFGLLIFDAMHRDMVSGDGDMFRAYRELLMLELLAIRTGYVHCEALKLLVGFLADESLSMYEQQALEFHSAMV